MKYFLIFIILNVILPCSFVHITSPQQKRHVGQVGVKMTANFPLHLRIYSGMAMQESHLSQTRTSERKFREWERERERKETLQYDKVLACSCPVVFLPQLYGNQRLEQWDHPQTERAWWTLQKQNHPSGKYDALVLLHFFCLLVCFSLTASTHFWSQTFHSQRL